MFRTMWPMDNLAKEIPLNIARYRKAVYSALWVQVTLVVCYLPACIAVALTPQNFIYLPC